MIGGLCLCLSGLPGEISLVAYSQCDGNRGHLHSFQLLTFIGLNIFLALGRIGQFNFLDLVGQTFVLINAVIALIVMNADLWILVSLNTATSVVIAFLIIVLVAVHGTRFKNALPWRIDFALLRKMLSYGFKFHVAILAGALIFRADILVVSHFRGAAQAGVYSVASQVALMLMLLPGVIATLLFPRVAAEQDAQPETTCLVSVTPRSCYCSVYRSNSAQSLLPLL